MPTTSRMNSITTPTRRNISYAKVGHGVCLGAAAAVHALIMSWKGSKKTLGMFGGRRAVAVLGLAGMFAAAGRIVIAHSDGDENHRGIVGVWSAQATLRNCQTNAPLGPPINALLTFHADGTLSESLGARSFAPGQRTDGHGSWRRMGRRTYTFALAALLLFDTPPDYLIPPGGFLAGWQTVSYKVTLVDDNHLTSIGTNAFYTSSSDVAYRTGCSTTVAERFE